MILFEYAPAVPATYERLIAALTPSEQEEAIRSGYVARRPKYDFLPAGAGSFGKHFTVSSEVNDWRNRMLLVWFCFIFENLKQIRNPAAALEEVLFELQGGPSGLDEGLIPLSTVYTGAAAWEPRSPDILDREESVLRPYYENAVRLLDSYNGKS